MNTDPTKENRVAASRSATSPPVPDGKARSDPQRGEARTLTGQLPPDVSSALVRRCAHDIRNDLGAILGFVEFLLSDPKTLSDATTVKELLQRIQMAAGNAVVAVNELRNLSGARVPNRSDHPVDRSRHKSP